MFLSSGDFYIEPLDHSYIYRTSCEIYECRFVMSGRRLSPKLPELSSLEGIKFTGHLPCQEGKKLG